MSESKKILYKRETASKALMDLSNRLTNFFDRSNPFPLDLNDVIIFGSYAKGASRVHDLDVFVSVTEHRDRYEEYWHNYVGDNFNVITSPSEILVSFGKFIKGKTRVISLHMDAFSTPEERDIATSDIHYYLVKNGCKR